MKSERGMIAIMLLVVLGLAALLIGSQVKEEHQSVQGDAYVQNGNRQ